MVARTVSDDLRNPVSRAAVLGAKHPDPPRVLALSERKIWDQITAVLSPAEMVGINPQLALYLVEAIISREDEVEILRKEGTVLTGPRGGAYANPRSYLVARHEASILRLQSRLRLSVGDGADEEALRLSKRSAARRAEHTHATIDSDGDDLLPTISDIHVPRGQHPAF